jgi:histidyl-tRNA synthetase
MSKVTPRIMSGFMELLPQEQLLFNRMFNTIRDTYELFGFTPISTPAIELAEVLLAKGGGETEQQIYRVSTRGDKEMVLHYDLTVPLARYVAEHENDLTFPFRRYQMQPVWRAERAQRGRFREFYQCDIDIIGSTEPIADAEVPSVIYEVFKRLNIGSFTIRINNRKVLNGLFAALGLTEQSVTILRTVDKIDKLGEAAVRDELSQLGVDTSIADQILSFVAIRGSNAEVIETLKELKLNSLLFEEGVEELATVCRLISSLGVPEENLRIDLAIARGLDYYTGTVYETVLDDYPGIGSVCSGGRFDNLADYYTDTSLPGVGVSIGLTRLFYQLREAGVITATAAAPTKVLVIKTSEELTEAALALATTLREAGISTEVYFAAQKLGKQFKYASQLGIPMVAVLGQKEADAKTVTIKTLATGQEEEIPQTVLVSWVAAKLESSV